MHIQCYSVLYNLKFLLKFSVQATNIKINCYLYFHQMYTYIIIYIHRPQ